MKLAVVVNTLLLLALGTVYAISDSQLAFAQAADSLLDLCAGALLLLTVWLQAQPPDANHPFGHGRAEPIGALVTALLAGVLAVAVAREAVVELWTGEAPVLALPVGAGLAAKLVVKLALFALVIGHRHAHTPAVKALALDTRNDVLMSFSSLAGFGLSRLGIIWADAGLALPIAGYIAYSGVALARENLKFLLGEAPDPTVLAQIRGGVAAVAGVVRVGDVRAHFVGDALHVQVSVEVSDDASATQSHDLAVAVQEAVERHDLVAYAFVHVDTPSGRDHP